MAEPRTPVPTHPLRWFPEFLEITRKRIRPQARLLGLSLVVGVVAGVGAIIFFAACQLVFHFSLDAIAGYHPQAPGGEPPIFGESATSLRPWLLVVVPAIGGILSGLLVFTLAPEAEGHGTDAAIRAYHHEQGLIRPRVPLVKIIASALTLGTGGSGGREGPIAQIGAGCGSALGTLLGALELFVENDLLALPVVDGSVQQRVIGIVKRADISSTYLRHVQGANVTGDGADYNV
jgi:H+/Cl- antiporter ClcA